MKIKLSDLDYIIILIYLITFAVVSFFFRNQLFLVIFGLPFMLVFPGYLLMLAMYPRKGTINLTERIALTIGLSFLLLPSIGLLLNFTPLGIRLGPLLAATVIISGLLCFIVWYQRQTIKDEDQFSPINHIRQNLREPGKYQLFQFTPGQRLVPTVLIIAIIMVIIGITYMMFIFMTTEQPSEHFTELIILDDNHQILEKPIELGLYSTKNLTLQVLNHEDESVNYLMRVSAVDISSAWTQNATGSAADNNFQPSENNAADLPSEWTNVSYIVNINSPLILDVNSSYVYNFTLENGKQLNIDMGIGFNNAGNYQTRFELYRVGANSEPALLRLVYIIILVS